LLDLLLIILFCVLGVITGIMTGLLPGLHVNNVALILLSLSGVIVGAFSFLFQYGITEQFILILVCIYIISTAISNAFHSSIPTTFLGAPEENTALSVLPAHSLLLEGKGYEAVALAALGSYGAIIFCFLLLYPLRFIIGGPLFFYSTLREIMLWVLIAISLLMIMTEKGRVDVFGKSGKTPSIVGILFAAFLFFLSGLFGLAISEVPVNSPVGFSSPVLFPALAGLFGTPTLLTSLIAKPNIPKQKIKQPKFNRKAKKATVLSVVAGSLAGIFVSIIPGVTSATGTILAMNTRAESDKRQVIITLSAVSTACAFFVVAVLFIILRARSGATLAVADLVTVEEWASLAIPTTLIYLLIAIILSGTLSYFSVLKIGKTFAKHFANVPYALLIKFTISMIVILVLLFTGILGLLVLIIATLIGLIPIHWGVRRSHCMGVLLIPIILYFI